MSIEEAVAAAWGDLGYWTTNIGTNLQDLIAEHGAVIHTKRRGGPVDRLQGRYRFSIEVYTSRYADLWPPAEEITRRLLNPPLWADPVLIDNARCEGSFAERPYTEGTRVVTSTWMLTVRHHIRRSA